MKGKQAKKMGPNSLEEPKRNLVRRRRPNLERPEPSLIEKPTLLIVCEGKATEPSYFSQFRLSSATIRAVGTGFNTFSLVKKAVHLASQARYDQVWCVFDKDAFSNADFNRAISLANAHRFGIAYSNQAFEYWILLHLEDHQGGKISRGQYGLKINKLLKPYTLSYGKKNNKIISEPLFKFLNGIDEQTQVSRRQLAIDRAKRILKQFGHTSPAQAESSTTVFRLVEELLKHS